ncbi:hypothetical protein BH10PSE3_BH10PSE3_20450 [soil metagenome]
MPFDMSQTLSQVFPGDSEMARRMREMDWAATSLGSPETWPTGLTTPLAMMLTSRFEMWLGWGEDLCFFYNDAYILPWAPSTRPPWVTRSARSGARSMPTSSLRSIR